VEAKSKNEKHVTEKIEKKLYIYTHILKGVEGEEKLRNRKKLKRGTFTKERVSQRQKIKHLETAERTPSIRQKKVYLFNFKQVHTIFKVWH